MARIYMLASPSEAQSIVAWLSREGGISENDIAAIVDYPGLATCPQDPPPGIPVLDLDRVRSTLTADDLVIVAGPRFDPVVAELFAAGIHNVFDGQAALAHSRLSRRFIRIAAPYHIGPNYPDLLDDSRAAFLRYTAEPLDPQQIPGHKLFVVNSMPKSGTVWMMAMLERLLGIKAKQQITLSHVMDLVTDVSKPNVHGAVILVRDLRDVVVSWYHDLARHDLRNGFAEPRYSSLTEFYFSYFIGQLGGNPRYAPGNLEGWLNMAACHGFPLVRYEDLVADTPYWLRKVMTFWKVRVPEQAIAEVADSLAFAQMPQTLAGQPGYVRDMVNTGHLRRGQVGAWKTELPSAVEQDIGRRFCAYQQRLRYGQ